MKFVHRDGEFGAPGCRVGIGRFGKDGRAALADGFAPVVGAEFIEQDFDRGDLALRFPDACARGVRSDRARGDVAVLPALEEPATLGTIRVDRASRAAERGAWLIEEALLLDPETECGECPRAVGGLEDDTVEERAVAAQSAVRAKMGGGGLGGFAVHAREVSRTSGCSKRAREGLTSRR